MLDEPNSNLDREGDDALTGAILGVRARGGIVVVVAHRPSALAGVDTVLIMLNGRQQACRTEGIRPARSGAATDERSNRWPLRGGGRSQEGAS